MLQIDYKHTDYTFIIDALRTLFRYLLRRTRKLHDKIITNKKLSISAI